MNYLNMFAERGGEFLISYADFVAKASNIKAIAFDWDGVYNSGVKGNDVYSNFSEVDSMGLNILRFGYQLYTGKILCAGIISGMNNLSTEIFIKREHLDFKCLGFKDKNEGFQHVIKEYNILPSEVAFVYDDILDLTLAKQCGLRFQVRRNATPMFTNYIKDHQLADYVTASTGECFAVREVCELLLASIGMYDDAVENRINFSDTYAKYIAERNTIETKAFLPEKNY